eukprot:TRINITY_DN70697_c0_g2_i1.p1 TRINITY_DN70697_c0_g2~~TRINITY_DN70697_c0_g2_i1.p1  ORF type:complete len:386 (-),score=57.96 TRINITY_DN70697_c0_g2_i1:130-1287(-)
MAAVPIFTAAPPHDLKHKPAKPAGPPSSPAKSHSTSKGPKAASTFYRGLACANLISCSVSQIFFNKWLLQEQQFPYPAALTCMHMCSGSLFALTALVVRPQLFWGLATLKRSPEGMPRTVCRLFLPIGVLYAGNLVLANEAYQYCSVAFLQMMKEGNIALVYVLGIFAGLDSFDWTRTCLLGFILMSTLGFVVGDVRFSTTGFMIQAGSQAFEVLRITLQSWLLSGPAKVDPLTLLLFMCPICCMSVATYVLWAWDHAMVEQAWKMWPALLLNCAMAVNLNLAICFVQQISAPTTFMLTGVVKDIVCILLSRLVFNDILLPQQYFCVLCALMGIYLHCIYRLAPEAFHRQLQDLNDFLANPLDGLPRRSKHALNAGGFLEKAASH